MNAQSYAQWCDLSGLYLANVSHADRYKTYTKKLSLPGVITIIIYDFLKDNRTKVDVAHWRTYSVYEPGADEKQRIMLTSTALEAIGASRVAEAVRVAKSQSPFQMFQKLDPRNPAAFQEAMKDIKGQDLLNHLKENVAQVYPEIASQEGHRLSAKSTSPSSSYESREQIELLIEKFVEKHTAELQADIDRYGDPRVAPGFTVKARMKELEEQRQQEISIKLQHEEIERFRELMKEIERVIAKDDNPNKRSTTYLRKLRRDFLDLIMENRRWKAEHLLPETVAIREETKTFMVSQSAVFQQDYIGNKKLTARAKTIGSFRGDVRDGETEISWETPHGFACDWTTFSLVAYFPKKQSPLFEILLGVVERLQRRWKTVCEQWRQELIACFRENYLGEMDDWELEDYEQDESGEPTHASILSHVEGATITLSIGSGDTEDDIVCSTFFNVEWDDEHGFELEWNDEPDSLETNNKTEFNPGTVQLVNSGRQLTPEDLRRFSAKFDLELPSEYRQFLLQFNGGEPQPGHVIIKQGFRQHGEVEQFLSLSDTETAPWPEGSIEEALQLGDDLNWPKSFLPIARVRVVTQDGGHSTTFLTLRLSGKRLGEIVAFSLEEISSQLAQLRNQAARNQLVDQMVEYAPSVAKSMNNLFEKKLKRRPNIKLPKWLHLLREDNILGFLKWIEDGGALTESFKHPELPLPWTVLDYLTREASAELLNTLIDQSLIQPDQLVASWRSHFQNRIDRFQTLMPLLPKSQWPYVLMSPQIWEHATLLEKLANANVDIDISINNEGATPLHQMVRAENKAAVKWLIMHGADPAKSDKFDRDAFLWAEHGSSRSCLRILQGKDESDLSAGTYSPDAPGIALLEEAAANLPQGHCLQISIQVKTPPVTRIEKAYYSDECHYSLSMDVCGEKVIYKDMNSPRQSYLYSDNWPSYLFTPILQWPELRILWDTLTVVDVDIPKALKSRKYQPELRPELLDAARSTLEQTFDSQEAEARRIEVRS